MSKNITYIFICLLIGLFLLSSVGFLFKPSTKISKEIPRTNERELKVNLQAGFGDLFVSSGGTDKILSANGEIENGKTMNDCLDYTIRDRVGYMSLSTDCSVDEYESKHKKNSFHIESADWDMKFNDEVPIAFDIELGLGKGVIDLTDLSVKDLHLSAGASSVRLMFNKHNKSEIENLTIEAGVSKFSGQGLINANFNHLRFEGGVGSYTLDFGGELEKEVDVDIEVGVGALTIKLPKRIAAKIYYEKNWLSHMSMDKDFVEEEDNTYYTANYRKASARMNIRIESGLGSVSIIHE